MELDERYMQRCLQLAELGAGNVAPNPMVGAVLVHNNRIIGEGYHEKYGRAHAEVNCLADTEARLADLSEAEISKILSESTLYVSLEPCAHYGKTPPCADLLVKKNVGNVVIACIDIFSEVNGKGIQKLKGGRVDVHTGMLKSEAIDLNKRFFAYHKNKRPYIILKWAESADGFISKKEHTRFAISNAYTNRLVHKWRSEEAAILVGTNTAFEDDPELTVRSWYGNNPVRIVIDKNCRLPGHFKLFNDTATTLVFNNSRDEQKGNVSCIRIDENNFLQNLVGKLYQLQLQSIIIEGGSITLQSFIDAGLWDEARIIKNSKLVIEDGVKAAILPVSPQINMLKIQDDVITFYKNKNSNVY